MLSRRERRLIAVASTLVVGVVASAWLLAGRGPRRVVDGAPGLGKGSSSSELSGDRGGPAIGEALPREVALGEAPEVPVTAPGGTPAPQPADALDGGVVGRLLGPLGEPLLGHRVSLHLGDFMEAESRFAVSGEEGFFEFVGVPAGVWTVGYEGEPGSGRGHASSRRVGEVVVVEGVRSSLDIVLSGTRRLTGAFTYAIPGSSGKLEDMDGASLHVQLVSRAVPGRVEADAIALTTEPEEIPADFELEPWDLPRVSGAFQLSGLEPGSYTLRVYLDVDRRWVLELPVDLSRGDLGLEPRRLTFQDFRRTGPGD